MVDSSVVQENTAEVVKERTKGRIRLETKTLGLVELWDPVSGGFERAGTLAEPRTMHTATVLPDGDILLIGGTDRNGSLLADAETWSPPASAVGG